MDIQAIRDCIKRLETIYTNPDASVQFRDSIILIYSHKVITELNKIFDVKQNEETLNEETLIEKLRSFLSNNWDLVKGSLLCYTALPENEITLLLCDIAEYIAEKHTDLAPIKILMPNIRCDSLFPDQYPNLDEADLTQVIKTHVLSQNYNFLISVSLLADENEDVVVVTRDSLATRVTFSNVYFQVGIDDASAVSLTDAELKLLAHHSDETRAVWDAKKQYESVAENKDSLLGQLNRLMKGLIQNSVNIMGQETDAGRYVYSAIVNFNEYWQNLPNHNAIPAEVLSEIEKILNLSTPKEKKKDNQTRNHVNLIETCLATRRQDLERAMVDHKILLAGISITPEQNKNRMDAVIKLRKTAQENLRNRLKAKDYSGQDQRGVTLKILDELKIELRLNNYTDVADVFKGLNADEVKIICASKCSSKKIVDAISTIENLVILTTLLNDEVLGSLFYGIKNNIGKLIQSHRDILALLISLEITQCAVVCKTLKKQLSMSITNAYNFLLVFLSLNHEQARVFHETLKKHLPSLIGSTTDFISVFKVLPAEEQTKFCESCKVYVYRFIRSTSNFIYILNQLSAEEQTKFYESYKEYLPSLIGSTTDFICVFKVLSAEEQANFYELLQERLPMLIKSTDDFLDIFKTLPAEEQTKFYESCKEYSYRFIRSASDFIYILNQLPAEEQTKFYESCKEYSYRFIRSTSEFVRVFKVLPAEQQIKFYELLQERLPMLMNSMGDFIYILNQLPAEQQIKFYELFKEQSFSIIPSNVHDAVAALKHLTSREFTIVCEILKESLFTIIDSRYNFKQLLLQLLNPEQCSILCEMLKRQIPKIILDSTDIVFVLEHLPPEKSIIVCKILKEQFSMLIKSTGDFLNVFKILPAEQQIKFYELLQERLPMLIKSTGDFLDIFKILPAEQQIKFYELLQERLPMLIKSMGDFINVFKALPYEEQSNFYELLQERLPVLIRDKNDLVDVLKALPAKQQIKFYASSQERFLSFIKDSDDFVHIIKLLHLDCHKTFFNALKNQLPRLITSSLDFSRVLKCLTSEQSTAIYESLKKQFPLFITTVRDFILVLKVLPLEQRIDFYEAFKKQLPELIKNQKDFKHLLRFLTPNEYKFISVSLKKYLFSIKNHVEFCSLFDGLDFQQQNAAGEPLTKRFASIEAFINNYETQFNASKQTKKEEELNTERVPNVEGHLKRVLSQLKEFVEKSAWNNHAIHLFRRPPDGIQKIRNLLASTQLDEFEKFNALHQILINKCNNPAYFRKAMTRNFYQGLLANFQDVSKDPEKIGTVLNEGARRRNFG